MHASALSAERRTLTPADDPAAIERWSIQAARTLDPALPARTVRDAGAIVRALVENALCHGAPPVTVELAATSVLIIEVTDHGARLPAVRADATGSLATIVDRLAVQWDVLEREDSKIVFAAVTIPDGTPHHLSTRRRGGAILPAEKEKTLC